VRNPTWSWGSAQDGAAGAGTLLTHPHEPNPHVRPSPGLVLAAMLVRRATQVARVVAPGRGPYAWTLLLSVAGMVTGELLAASGHLDVAAVGVLHPVADVLVIAVVQVVGQLLVGPGRDRPG
jgi:hypothetical protein